MNAIQLNQLRDGELYFAYYRGNRLETGWYLAVCQITTSPWLLLLHPFHAMIEARRAVEIRGPIELPADVPQQLIAARATWPPSAM